MDPRQIQQELHKERSAHLQTRTKLQTVEKEHEALKNQLTAEKEAHERDKAQLKKYEDDIRELKGKDWIRVASQLPTAIIKKPQEACIVTPKTLNSRKEK